MKVVLFTDTLGDLNGVSRFIQDMAEFALQNGDDLTVITSTYKNCPEASNIINFKPRFKIPMPYYKELDLVFPPKKEIYSFIKTLQPDLIHISTPGPIGLLGRKIAKKLDIKMLGTYHTDFPAYIKDNTGSTMLKKLTDKWMKNFYKDFLHVFSRSEKYHEIMSNDIGINIEKISYIPAGTNLKKFSKIHFKEKFWQKYNLDNNNLKALYVGRITKEKNIPFLLDMWEQFKIIHPNSPLDLVLVGEGSIKKRAEKLKHIGVHYLGAIIGEDLSSIYASSDMFLFPSLTDTSLSN